MLHYAAHATPPDLLFRDWHEARQLWDRMLNLGPARALVVMPDHVHLLIRELDPGAWAHFLRSYACWRNLHRGEVGRRVWLPADPPEDLSSSKHLRRTARYIALNPCRDHLVKDPLAWAFGCHRDAVGLAVPGAVPAERDPAGHHAYVSGDPTVRVEGTELPSGLGSLRAATVEQVRDAVSALSRTPVEDLSRRGPARTFLIQSLVACTKLPARAVAREVGVSHPAVLATEPIASGTLSRVERVLGDPRFPALHLQDLSQAWAFRRYVEGRERRGAYAALLANSQVRLRAHR
ncbi:MAG: hypothetical protein ABIO70_12720 [Pseudomonadota bacterium]